jgi:hypothetical protein
MAKGGKQESLDRFLTQTPNNNNKRSDPFSPDNISPSLLQVQKQARLNSSPTTPEHPCRLASNSDPPPTYLMILVYHPSPSWMLFTILCRPQNHRKSLYMHKKCQKYTQTLFHNIKLHNIVAGNSNLRSIL